MSFLSRRAFFKIAGLTAVVGAVETLARRETHAAQMVQSANAANAAQSVPAAPAERGRRQRGAHSQNQPLHPHRPHQQQALRSQRPPADTAHETRYTFFNPDDAAFIEAAVERLIPADRHGPGALQTGVPIFIDRQLAGAWGNGERLYRNGPWQPAAPAKGHRLPHTPAELFRAALRGIEIDLARRPQAPPARLANKAGNAGTELAAVSPVLIASIVPRSTSSRRDFARLPSGAQDAYLETLKGGGKDLAGIPSQVFFETLLGLTIEGFFSDPIHGGDEEMVASHLGHVGTHDVMSKLT